MTAAARENGHRLEARFGEALWKVALEPGCRMGKKRRYCAACTVVNIHALSPLTDKILIGIPE